MLTRNRKNPIFTGLALVGITGLALVGCSSSMDDGDDTAPDAPDTSEPVETEEEMDPAYDGLVGMGCSAYDEEVPDGDGSIVGMSQDPVAVAASNNPLLTQLVSAVSGELNPEVDLVDTLNADEFTVFAPVDDAFAALDDETVEMLQTPEGTETLTEVLTYHVVEGQIAPDSIVGEQMTLQGGALTVEGSGDDLTVNGATVICGGVQTANATVYLIDEVLMP